MESESADVAQVSGERLFGDIHYKYPPAILIRVLIQNKIVTSCPPNVKRPHK